MCKEKTVHYSLNEQCTHSTTVYTRITSKQCKSIYISHEQRFSRAFNKFRRTNKNICVKVIRLPKRSAIICFCFFCYVSALESKLVSQFCEDENGALVYNRVTNGYNSNNGNRNGNYAIGGYGYRPVTEQHILGDGQTSVNSGSSSHSNRGQTETILHGSKGSSSTRVEKPATLQYFKKKIPNVTWLND